ncbi:9964_t:CDS:2 [Cetraspora pellucida]|uniref:9964_t:CDS:1 n=1 Tax=Cetraspora pellucida TaxID=1433469 RepID=A0A9N9A2G3_9GLOM|nr:9964_t:CDS:2 [Cetraspora pellucida]
MSDYNQFYVRFIRVFIFLFLIVKSNAAENLSPGNCVQTFSSDVDYFPSKVTVTTASLFTIKYNNNYKLVTNTNSKETFALVQCGTPIPTGLPAGTKVFNISLNNVAIMDTSVVPFLEVLGLRSHITELGSESASSSPCLQALNLTVISATNMTLQNQQLSKVDAVFDSTFNLSNPKTIGISTVNDPGLLNRAEWIKFYSVFFNLEDKANTIYNQISDNYNCLKKLPSSNNPPTVAWVSYIAPASFNNNTASWSITDAPYKKILTENAGGIYFNTTPLSYSTSSSFLSAIANVDILIDETFIARDISEVYTNFNLNANDVQYKFVKNSAIYREDGVTSPGDGRDWFESAVLLADNVLEDMMNVINPNLPTTDYKRVWLRNVAKSELIKLSSPSNCSDASVALTYPNLQDAERKSGSVEPGTEIS